MAKTSKITLERVLWSPHRYRAEYTLATKSIAVAKVTAVSSGDGLDLVLVGSNLDQAMLLYPADCQDCYKATQGSYATLQVPAPKAKNLKQIVLCSKSHSECDHSVQPIFIAPPKDETAPEKPTLKDGTSVPVGAANALVSGTQLGQIVSVYYADVPLKFWLTSGDTPQLTISLPPDISARAAQYPLAVKFADKTLMAYTLTVK